MSKQSIEEILDLSILELSRGKTLKAVLAMYPEHQEELSELLNTIQPAITLPKNGIPMPVHRKKYISAMHVPWQQKLQNIFKVAIIPLTAVFIFVGGTQFVVAAQHSLPGDTLYRFKLAAERTRVAITTNQTKKAKLELAYSQKRIEEVSTVLKQDITPDQQAEALNILKEQTEKTFALVPSVATSDAITNNDPTLFKELIAVNNQQKDLLKTLPEQEATKEIADSTLQATEDQEKTLATLIIAVNDPGLLELVEQEVNASGIVQYISLNKQQILVGNQYFSITEETQIKQGENILKLGSLPIKSQVSVVAVKKGETLVAETVEITISSTAAGSGEVKGVKTIKPSTDPTVPTENETVSPDPEETEVIEPGTLTGGYIAEQ